MALTLAKTIIKVGAGIGAIYVIVEHGVWGRGTETSETFKKLRNIMPGTTEYTSKIPSASDVYHESVSYWNSGVQYAFSGLANLPTRTEEGTKIIYKKAADSLISSKNDENK
ncbi:Uncharacterised protein g9715 [Pycnogonum litorale]